MAARIRVLTLNLWAREGDWGQRRRALVAGLEQLAPDIIAFQESVVHDGYDQVADLLGRAFHVAHQRRRAADGMGVSIASRWPLQRVTELDLHLTPRTDEFPCTTLVADVAVPQPIGPVMFVNHFPSYQLAFEHERQVQTVAAARLVDELVGLRGAHVVLAGDLDADPGAGSIRFWTGREALDGLSVCYRDAWESVNPRDEGHTYTPRNPLVAAKGADWPFRRIDYILVRCDRDGPTLNVEDCHLAFDQPLDGVWASDHFGVVADLVTVPVG